MATKSLPLICVAEGEATAAGIRPGQARWAEANGFTGQRGRLLALPRRGSASPAISSVWATQPAVRRLSLGLAAAALEPGRYHLAGDVGDPHLAALGFRLGAYRFDRYRKPKGEVTLDTPQGADCG